MGGMPANAANDTPASMTGERNVDDAQGTQHDAQHEMQHGTQHDAHHGAHHDAQHAPSRAE